MTYDRDTAARFYRCLLAVGHFAGKPLKATDAHLALDSVEVVNFEKLLRKLAAHYRSEDAKVWPELHKLADQIEEELNYHFDME